MIWRHLTILLMLSLLSALCFADEPALPTYEVTRIDRDLTLSGKVDDPLWQKAAVVGMTDTDSGKPAQDTTGVRLLYNERYLYVAYACEDPYVWATYTKPDDPLYEEECVETFLAPSGSFRTYYEIEVNPLNTILDSYMMSQSKPDGSFRYLQFLSSYTCEKLVTMVHVDGELGKPGAKGWSVEYAIPFASIVGRDNIVPNPGDRWRANFCRVDSPQPGKPTYASWAPLGTHDFHRSYRFGWLVFK